MASAIIACEDDYYDPFPNAAEVNLTEKYYFTVVASIWNMPNDDKFKSSYSIYIYTLNTQLPNIEMSVKIVTETKQFTSIFVWDSCVGTCAEPPTFSHYYSTNKSFRLADGESWTMLVTVKIAYEKQTIELTGMVGVIY